jgi:hypothetical protein
MSSDSRGSAVWRCATALTALIFSAAAAAQVPHGPSLPRGPVGGTPFTLSGAKSPNTFGITNDSVTTISAYDFQGFNSTDIINGFLPYAYRFMAGGTLTMIAPLHLDEGAVVDLILWDNCDFAGGQMSLVLGDFTDSNVTSLASFPSATKAACGLDGFILQTPYVNVTNSGHELLVTVGQVLGGPTLTGRVEIWWHRSISPAPATATFNDVPTTDPAFQYIEALVASGITVGCGPAVYCPDAPLTRRQMAVFISKALGLHWPNTLPF